MMQEINSDDTNGESTFEFVERRLDDLHLGPSSNGSGGGSTPQSPPTTAIQSERMGSHEASSVTLPSIASPIAAPAPLPQFYSQHSSPAAPVPTYSVSSLPPPPITLPSFVTGVSQVSEPSLTAFPTPNPILAPYSLPTTAGVSLVSQQPQQQSYPAAPAAATYSAASSGAQVTSLDLPYGEYGAGGGVQSQTADYEAGGGREGGGVWGWIKGTVTGNEFLSKVAEKAKSSVDSVITTLDPQMSEYIYSGGDIQIIVASDKNVKVEPVREAFQTVLGRATAVTGVSAQSSVAAQPVGFSAGLKGAEDRIAALRQSGMIDDRQPIVAIENTLVEVTPERWYDVGCLVLDDPSIGQAIHSYTQLVPVAIEYVQQLQKDTPADYPLRWSGYSMTIGHVLGLALQVPHNEWHQHVSGISRRDMILVAAKVLATTYRRRRESLLLSQPAWSMG